MNRFKLTLIAIGGLGAAWQFFSLGWSLLTTCEALLHIYNGLSAWTSIST